MDERKEKNAAWLSVPQFGDWDLKGNVPDYSMDFTKIRENRKQNKRETSRASLGNEEELVSNQRSNSDDSEDNQNQQFHHLPHNHTPTPRRSVFSYFNCCIKA